MECVLGNDIHSFHHADIYIGFANCQRVYGIRRKFHFRPDGVLSAIISEKRIFPGIPYFILIDSQSGSSIVCRILLKCGGMNVIAKQIIISYEENIAIDIMNNERYIITDPKFFPIRICNFTFDISDLLSIIHIDAFLRSKPHPSQSILGNTQNRRL